MASSHGVTLPHRTLCSGCSSNGQELGDPCCKWQQGATPLRTTAISHPGLASSAARSAGCPTATAAAGPAAPATRTPTTVVVQGEENTNECPVGAAVIHSQEECERAGAILGYDYWNTYLEPDYPKGCYLWAGYAYFNAHPVGSADPYARVICYLWTAAPTAAPTRIGDTISPTALPTTEGAA
jgi:hypothetical protein